MKEIEPVKYEYEYPDGCAEISGFRGGYEACCRNMVIAGMKWLEVHPKADPEMGTYAGVYGNQDAKDLQAAMLKGAEGDCTGAMMQAACSHVFHARKNGWEKYIEWSKVQQKKRIAKGET